MSTSEDHQIEVRTINVLSLLRVKREIVNQQIKAIIMCDDLIVQSFDMPDEQEYTVTGFMDLFSIPIQYMNLVEEKVDRDFMKMVVILDKNTKLFPILIKIINIVIDASNKIS